MALIPASKLLGTAADAKEPHLVVLAESRLAAEGGTSPIQTILDLDKVRPPADWHPPVEPQAVALKKADARNPFSSMITLGRAPNNDVVLDDPRVSKFHCYFRKIGDGWTICDANSTNGTKVDGRRLPGENSHPLRSCSRITLSSDLVLLFVLPADLKAVLERELATARRAGDVPPA